MNVIVVEAGGPYRCSGAIELCDSDGQVIALRREARLCRCGLSREKPLCDGSHARLDCLRESLHVGEVEPAVADGTLRVRPRKDGPLKLDGPCEVRAEDGTVLMRGAETALCRCGQSKRKPFCDGTHRQSGFEAAQ
jgi:CDGSH-type Zn-finger protein